MTVRPKSTSVVLTIAGSDSGGGAGIQADLKTFAAFGVFGTSAVTCLTAQNPDGVRGIAPVPRGFVAKQISTVCSAFPVKAAKTGMLFSAAIIRETARELSRHRIRHIVVDPVARATSGSSLLMASAEKALISQILPMASVVTPNIPEAEMLLGGKIMDKSDQADAAHAIEKQFGVSCLLKGGHMPGRTMLDILCHKGRIHAITAPRVNARETHGTGCTLSAALTACLAMGLTLPDAAGKACKFVQSALRKPLRTGKHFPLGIAAQR